VRSVLIANDYGFLVISLTLIAVVVAWIGGSICPEVLKFLCDRVLIWLELNVIALAQIHVPHDLVRL